MVGLLPLASCTTFGVSGFLAVCVVVFFHFSEEDEEKWLLAHSRGECCL